jgi:hypothetical protein
VRRQISTWDGQRRHRDQRERNGERDALAEQLSSRRLEAGDRRVGAQVVDQPERDHGDGDRGESPEGEQRHVEVDAAAAVREWLRPIAPRAHDEVGDEDRNVPERDQRESAPEVRGVPALLGVEVEPDGRHPDEERAEEEPNRSTRHDDPPRASETRG